MPVKLFAGSLTVEKTKAREGVISTSDGARKPRPQLARSNTSGVGLNFSPSFGFVVLPKSL